MSAVIRFPSDCVPVPSELEQSLSDALLALGVTIEKEETFERRPGSTADAVFDVVIDCGAGESAAVLIDHRGVRFWRLEKYPSKFLQARTAVIRARLRPSADQRAAERELVRVRVLRFRGQIGPRLRQWVEQAVASSSTERGDWPELLADEVLTRSLESTNYYGTPRDFFRIGSDYRRQLRRFSHGFDPSFLSDGPPEPPPDEPPSRVEIHAAAEMPKELLVGRDCSVEVRIAPHALQLAAERAGALGTALADPARKLTVQIFARKNVCVIDDALVHLEVPQHETPLYFTVRGTDEGQALVEVIVRQGPIPLVILKLEATVARVAEVGSSSRAEGVAHVPLQAALNLPEHRLMILERQEGTATSFEFVLESPSVGRSVRATSKPLVTDRAQYVTDLYKEIEEVRVSNANDSDSFQSDLRAFGGRLLDDLVPLEIQRELYLHHHEWGCVFVQSTEPFIPWELVVIKDPSNPIVTESSPFLAELGVVRWLYNRDWPPHAFVLRPGSAFHVCPDYPVAEYKLPQASLEIADVAQILGSTAIAATARAVKQQLKSEGKVRLFHFAGHGQADPGHALDSHIMLEGRIEGPDYVPDILRSDWIGQSAKVGRNGESRAVIVLNACRAAQLSLHLTGVGGFAEAFLKAGAGAFISAQWAVGDLPARNFVTALYREWTKPGVPLRQAVAAARRAARTAGEATWLAYVAYGNPEATLSVGGLG